MVGAGGILIGNGSPVDVDFNSLLIVAINQAAYILQKGMALWDVNTTYFVGDVQNYGSPPVPWQSQVNNNLGVVPGTDATKWKPWAQFFTAPGMAKAFVNFVGNGGGGACVLNSSFNVSGVVRNGLGDYTITFSPALADANYIVNGQTGAPNAAAPISGGLTNQGLVLANSVAGATGNAVKTTTTLRIYCVNLSGAPHDAINIMVTIFNAN